MTEFHILLKPPFSLISATNGNKRRNLMLNRILYYRSLPSVTCIGELSVNIKYLRASTLVELTQENPVLDPLGVQHLDNQLFCNNLNVVFLQSYVPSGSKDEKYWEKRVKNNIAARRSREARRLKENQVCSCSFAEFAKSFVIVLQTNLSSHWLLLSLLLSHWQSILRKVGNWEVESCSELRCIRSYLANFMD